MPGKHPKPDHLWNRDKQAYLNDAGHDVNLESILKGGDGGQEAAEEY